MKKIFLILPFFLVSCNEGQSSSAFNSSETKNTTMPIFANVCSSSNYAGNINYNQYEDTDLSCIPGMLNKEVSSEPLTEDKKNIVAQYYYGQDFNGTCPDIGEKSEVQFPTNSPYSINQKLIVDKAIDCLKNSSILPIYKPIFVFDVDDTLVLSSYISMCHTGFTYNWDNYTNSLEKNAFIAVPEMVRLLDYALQHNITVAFVTGRSQNYAQITENNLIAAYPNNIQQIKTVFNSGDAFFENESVKGWSVDAYKNQARQTLINRGYTILLNVGDQYSDLNYDSVYKNNAICSYKLSNMIYYIP